MVQLCHGRCRRSASELRKSVKQLCNGVCLRNDSALRKSVNHQCELQTHCLNLCFAVETARRSLSSSSARGESFEKPNRIQPPTDDAMSAGERASEKRRLWLWIAVNASRTFILNSNCRKGCNVEYMCHQPMMSLLQIPMLEIRKSVCKDKNLSPTARLAPVRLGTSPPSA